MKPEDDRPRPRFPRALAWALAVPLAASAGTWAIASLGLATSRRSVLVLGDSNIANFRLLQGQRFEDRLSADLGPGFVVRNWGEIGADPADQYLALCRAELLRFHPDFVVLVLSPHAFIPDTTTEGHRFREDGDGLRWLPWSAEGYRFFTTLSRGEKQKALVRAVEPLFGFYDGYRALAVHSDWPALRQEQAARTPALQAAIVDGYSRKISRYLDLNLHLGSYREFSARPTARDFGFLADALAARRTPFLVVVLPEGDPKVLAQSFSDNTRALLEKSYAFSVRLLSEHEVPFLDYNSKAERERFQSADFGDHYHLKSASAYRLMADGVAEWIEQHARRGS